MYYPKFLKVYKSSMKYVNWYDIAVSEMGPLPVKQQTLFMRSWAQELLDHLKMDVTTIGEPTCNEKVIYVGNHVSYVDIPLLLSQACVSFVAKAELLKWPVLNSAFKRARIIFVDRDSDSSRRSTINSITSALKDGDLSVAIFPSGTTDIAERKPWRKGAFKIAQHAGVKIKPFRVGYSPLRTAAYIDNDFFPLHLWKIMRNPGIKATIEFHDAVEVENPHTDAKKWQLWSQELLEKG